MVRDQMMDTCLHVAVKKGDVKTVKVIMEVTKQRGEWGRPDSPPPHLFPQNQVCNSFKTEEKLGGGGRIKRKISPQINSLSVLRSPPPPPPLLTR